MKRILFALASLFFLSETVLAQDILSSAITWNVDSLRDLTTSDQFAYTCSFETSNQNEIVWKQSGGFNSVITIITSTGTWMNVQVPGAITFSIKYEDETGTMQFERIASRYRITLSLGDPNQPVLWHEYFVSTISLIP